MKSDENNKNTKLELRKKALKLIEEKGYDNVTVDEICEELGLTKGAFYYYFKSKSEILLKNYKNTEGDLMYYYTQRIKLPAEDQLRAIFDWYISYFSSDDYLKFNNFIKTQLENYNKNYPISNTTQRIILKNIIDKGIEQGVFNDKLDSYEVANYVYIYISGLSYVFNVEYSKIDFKRELDKFYYKYLMPLLKPEE